MKAKDTVALATSRIALLLSVAALAAAGCGGGGSKPPSPAGRLAPSTATTGTTLTAGTAAFAAQVRAVCRRANAAAASVEGDANQLAAVLDRYLPEFRAVSVPPPLQAAYAQLLSNLSKISAALRRGDIATVKRLENVDHRLAARLGIRHCAG